MEPLTIVGIIALVTVMVLGTAIKIHTSRKVKKLDGTVGEKK